MSDKTQQNELALAIQASGLQENTIENLMKSFSQSFNDARIVVDSAKEILVTDENDVEGMKLAREKRLELKKIRTTVENTRKDLKEQALREGKAIDGAANIIKALIAPVEEHLEKQEKFAEVKAMERLEQKYTDRIKELQMYVEDVTVYSLKEMSDDAFAKLLETSKTNFQAKKDAEAKAEADRIEQEKKEKLANNRRIEMSPFIEFLDHGLDTDQKLNDELWYASEDRYQSYLKKAKEARKKYNDEQEKIRIDNERMKKEAAEKERQVAIERAENQKKIDEANAAKLEAEKKLKDQQRLEEQKKLEEQKRVEDQKRLEEEQKRQALLAPDKFKLIELAKSVLSIELPAVSSKQAGDVVKEVERVMTDLNTYILNKAKAL